MILNEDEDEDDKEEQYERVPSSSSRRSSTRLVKRLSLAKELWIQCKSNRSLVFVPHETDVSHVVGVLRFWGVHRARDLQDLLGIAAPAPTPAASRKTSVEGKRRRSGREEGGGGGGDGRRCGRGRLKTSEIVARAALHGIGSSSSSSSSSSSFTANNSFPLEALDRGDTIPTEHLNHEADTETRTEEGSEIFVVPMTGSRGLHVQSVDNVFVLLPPRTMDEYLHMAGRTGRAGANGTVISFVNLEELKRM
eukprot:CAMPEP_0182438544 /NCGR_PEP_ID=MMETSP1167-20130531/85847_1 /TAXON_ID=2988 /ORGANISM="Mallomonas Sp, Strain CCMP3275" /LENGTH=250 /DNA_ID=CAMNT_0024631957 /DNA_START=562 /DNA_END=1311 /DNA_ORIENTATION=+